jgi:hypothetical protein
MKTTPKIGKVSAINLVDDTTEMMLISQFGKIIRIDAKTIRSAGRSTSGVKLLNLDADDKVAAAVGIPPPNTPKPNPKTAPCYSDLSGRNARCVRPNLIPSQQRMRFTDGQWRAV